MGMPTNLRHTSCFEHSRLSSNDCTDLSLKSPILEFLLSIGFLMYSTRISIYLLLNKVWEHMIMA
jgi:hypothetical protein